MAVPKVAKSFVKLVRRQNRHALRLLPRRPEDVVVDVNVVIVVDETVPDDARDAADV